jgi:hypothetical protein
MADVNMEESATVVWNEKPVMGTIGNGTGAAPRHFERFADALAFVFAEVPEEHRESAHINTSGHVYHYEDLVTIRDAQQHHERAVRPEYEAGKISEKSYIP